MIYVQKYSLLQGKYAVTPQRIILTSELSSAIEFIEDSLDAVFPLAYLKDLNSDNLIEIKLVGNQTVISYVLDLFDFVKEFEN